ncbi:hypothetical protein [Sediminibacterium sp.]|uniref:hypothetical protein n=1 Tax=Sediminibacterium sp. TaxID=1917865 RepID=UPI002730F954|nr:hypothetical protein [Sediminibacterium sp.]MDP1973071.1 hypothetical protein [Sediminibacterium sp.]MDP2420087.1 hypothetical protein [Sediminibacterium sp.]
MRIDDVIYFAPGIRAIDLDFNNREQILEGFKNRIYSYYLLPAEKLNVQEFAFASGVILMATIDAITYYSIGGNNRIKDFMFQCKILDGMPEDRKRLVVKAFDDYFRNGLIHEGRIKNGCQFSYEYGFVYFDDTFLVINPKMLYNEVTEYFQNYLDTLSKHTGAFTQFYQKFYRQYYPEIQSIKRQNT